jgi:hypothetical protein
VTNDELIGILAGLAVDADDEVELLRARNRCLESVLSSIVYLLEAHGLMDRPESLRNPSPSGARR